MGIFLCRDAVTTRDRRGLLLLLFDAAVGVLEMPIRHFKLSQTSLLI